MPNIFLEWDDNWLEEVRSLIETQRGPDNLDAFRAKLNTRIGGERSYEQVLGYLSNCLYNAIRYADAVARGHFGDAIPTVVNPSEAPVSIGHGGAGDEGRVISLDEVGVLSTPLAR
jgi:hypothetical protein